MTREERKEYMKNYFQKNKKEIQKRHQENKRQWEYNMKKALGIRTTKPKPQNTLEERIRQDEITNYWLMFGWFLDPSDKK